MNTFSRTRLSWARATPEAAPHLHGRVTAIDFARGAAVALMILNHGVKGLLPFEDYPDWGLVPIHMVTRFASSLFIMVFGIALAVAYLPHVRSKSWPRRRNKLLLTGVTIFFWYKVLTVFEMLPFEPAQIRDALLYRAFPSFVEILGFYAIALLWIPFFLPLWQRMPLWARLLTPVALTLLSYWLQNQVEWNSEILQAMLVEHESHYTWGQISRAPLVMLGLLLGEAIRYCYSDGRARRRLALSFACVCALLGSLFLLINLPDLQQAFRDVALNEGKHPPELLFMLFSLSGAFGILAIAIAGGERLARILRPVTTIGSDALQAFIFHIFVIFVIVRYLWGYWHNIAYESALIFTVCLIFATAAWIKIQAWVRTRS
jgi:fucose 4-O-acetylase-like acetyltransferase